MINKKLIITIFLFCFILLFLIQNIIYLQNDQYPRGSDSHYFRLLLYYDQFYNGVDSELYRITYPPLFYLVPLPLLKLIGINTFVPRFAITLVTIVFLLAMFGIGYELGGPLSGATVMSLASSSPLLLYLSRRYLPEVPQTAATAVCFYLLLKSNSYKNRLYSILLGIALAVSFLFKWSSAFFLLVPILWFLIPNIFSSKRAFFTFLVFLLPALATGGGMFWFFKNIASDPRIPQSKLIHYYFPIVVIPGAILICLLLFLDYRYKSDKSYKNSGANGIVNFSLLSVIFALVGSPWFFWGAKGLSGKYRVLVYETRFPEENLRAIKQLYLDGFNFLIPLLIIGIIFIFISRRDIYKRLVLPVNLLIITPAMYWLTYSDPRYLLSLIIFIAALGGYWVCEIPVALNRVKKNGEKSTENSAKNKAGAVELYVAGFLIFISVLSMLGGSVLSKDLFIYKPRGILTASEPPLVNPYNIEEAVDFLKPAKNNKWKNIHIYTKRWPPFDFEYIQFIAFKRGRKIEALLGYNEQDFHYRFNRQIDEIKNDLYSIRLQQDRINQSFISSFVNKKGKCYDYILSKFSKETLQALNSWDKNTDVPENIRKLLIGDLQKIIDGPCIYDKDKFSNTPLSDTVRKSIQNEVKGKQLKWLNLMILNEIYEHRLVSGAEEDTWVKLNKVDEIIILRKDEDSIDFIIKTFKKMYPDVEFKNSDFDVGNSYVITIIRIVRN